MFTKIRNLTKTSMALMIMLIAVACVFTATTVFASNSAAINHQPVINLATARMVDIPKEVLSFNENAERSRLSDEVVKTIKTDITYTNQDYVEAANAGVVTCANNATFTAEYGCVCDAGFSGDGKSECIENPVVAYADGFDASGWASVTHDTSAYWSDNSIVNAALSLVGATGYHCSDVVDYALSTIGWKGSYFDGVEVGLEGMVPGDVIVYPSHYALYVGDGKAVHGGYNGGNVILGDVVVGKIPYTAYHCQY